MPLYLCSIFCNPSLEQLSTASYAFGVRNKPQTVPVTLHNQFVFVVIPVIDPETSSSRVKILLLCVHLHELPAALSQHPVEYFVSVFNVAEIGLGTKGC